jgi:phosphoribosylaminoimidazole-succinocarboxamide synthase
VYNLCRDYALERGVDIIDIKLECGNNIIADEIITPDSSRIVLSKDIKEGSEPMWMDKEIFRKYAEETWGNKAKVPIIFPDDVILSGSNVYLKVFKILTGMSLQEFQRRFTA